LAVQAITDQRRMRGVATLQAHATSRSIPARKTPFSPRRAAASGPEHRLEPLAWNATLELALMSRQTEDVTDHGRLAQRRHSHWTDPVRCPLCDALCQLRDGVSTSARCAGKARLNPADIGLVLAMSTAVRLAAGPAAGRIADALNALRAVFAYCALAAAATVLGFLGGGDFAETRDRCLRG
jgi:hypothetical protein